VNSNERDDQTQTRPPPSDKGQRPISLHITLHADEHEAIGAAAKAAKVKPTRFVREAALRAAKAVKRPPFGNMD